MIRRTWHRLVYLFWRTVAERYATAAARCFCTKHSRRGMRYADRALQFQRRQAAALKALARCP